MSNPYLSLMRTSWRYARKERGRLVLIYALFVMANLANASRPLLYGSFVDAIQQRPAGTLHYAWIYGAAYVALKFAVFTGRSGSWNGGWRLTSAAIS